MPWTTVYVDASTVGDESSDIVRGQQAFKTQWLFKEYGFNAILLSAGGNDLKNLYADKINQYSADGISAAEIAQLSRASEYAANFAGVIDNIKKFIGFRDKSSNILTRQAPILLHGYDYIQPRPAKARIIGGGSLGLGPWLHPALLSAGFTDIQMRSAADAVVDQLNAMLASEIASMVNVYVIDSRGLHTPAQPRSVSENADWLDEIHPNGAGFEKLAKNCWNKPLAKLLGYDFQPDELMPAIKRMTETTALAEVPAPAVA